MKREFSATAKDKPKKVIPNNISKTGGTILIIGGKQCKTSATKEPRLAKIGEIKIVPPKEPSIIISVVRNKKTKAETKSNAAREPIVEETEPAFDGKVGKLLLSEQKDSTDTLVETNELVVGAACVASESLSTIGYTKMVGNMKLVLKRGNENISASPSKLSFAAVVSSQFVKASELKVSTKGKEAVKPKVLFKPNIIVKAKVSDFVKLDNALGLGVNKVVGELPKDEWTVVTYKKSKNAARLHQATGTNC